MDLFTFQSMDGDDRMIGLVQAATSMVILALALEQPAPPGSPHRAEWEAGLVDLVKTAGHVTDGHISSTTDVIIAGITTLPLYASAVPSAFSGDVERWQPNLDVIDSLDSLEGNNDEHWVFVRTLKYSLPFVSGWHRLDRSALTHIPR